MARAAVAYASASPRSGPTTVTERSSVAAVPRYGSTTWCPRSYVPDVAIARSVPLSTQHTRSACQGCRIPTRHSCPGAGRPRTRTSPPALRQWSTAPAAASRSAATWTDHPFTYPDGSSRPVAYASKYPSVARHSSAQVSSTLRRSGEPAVASSSACSDVQYAVLVYVAPDTVAILALCAASVSCWSLATARVQMSRDSPEASPQDPLATVIFPPDTVTVTVTTS